MVSGIIGRLESVWRYPIKSMAGEEVDAIYVHETGLNGDRMFAFYDHHSRRAGLPYLTGREKRDLLLLKPRIIEEPDKTKPYSEGYAPNVNVELPDKRIVTVTDPALIEYLRSSVTSRDISISLDYRRAGMYDSKPVSIMGTRTIDAISRESEVDNLDRRRFRENFYVAWNDETPFFEDSLVGKCLQIGNDVLLHVVKRNERCPMICIDPETAAYDRRILGAVAKNHETNAGVYAMVRKMGVVRKGDSVVLV